MSSKYDAFWRDKSAELSRNIQKAHRHAKQTSMDVSDLKLLGSRGSWAATAAVQGKRVVRSSVAVHIKSLVRTTAALGLCSRFPCDMFVFTISRNCQLSIVTAVGGILQRNARTLRTRNFLGKRDGASNISDVMVALHTYSKSLSAGDFLSEPHNLPNEVKEPGLYSWWANESARKQLSVPLSDALHTGKMLSELIYAGLAGATLLTRIRDMHLKGTIEFSTLRRTLAALLWNELELSVSGRGELRSGGEARLTRWMCEHLRVAMVPYTHLPTLEEAERAMLVDLDPPLNLKNMPRTPVRTILSQKRSRLRKWN